jgi:uncharacterized protein (DUF885 family)
MAEGWACYATDLMDEFGFLTPLEHYAQVQSRLRMCARALMDVRLHQGTITLDQAAVFYQERVGMPAAAARAEATKNSMYPGTALMYLLGSDAIQHLRRDMAERPGFELRAFHDKLLSYGSIPVALSAAAPHLYFLFYHSPAPFDGLPEVDYLVTPIEPELPADEQERLLRANNDSVIKLNHVVHHGAIGHHVQNWHAFRAESRIGQIAAVDCASRIAMHCGGTMAEGWACYATDLMAEIGFLTPLEGFAERHTRLRMAARALADVRLHHATWTLEQTAEFYQQRVGMAPAAAGGEAVKNSMVPATALMYLMGTDAIHKLRRELAARPEFELRAFHDKLLSYGSIPVALAAKTMGGAF